MSLSFSLSPFWLVLCALVAGGLTYWMYRDTTPALATARRAFLVTLRFGAVFLVLFLLFEPILRRLQRDTQPPTLAVLIDDSQSLSLAAPGADSSAAGFGEAVRRLVGDLRGSDLDGEARYFTFSSDVQPLPADSLGALRFDGARTNVAQALDYVRDELQNANLQGVLLISDGQFNTGRNPLYLAERYPVPIHTVVVGDTTSRRDIQVGRIVTNEIAYVDTELPVRVGLRSVDFGGELVTVSLLHDGEVLNSTRTQLPDGTAEVPVDLAFTPEEAGLQRLSVAVTRLDGEVTYRNNTESFAVRVLESKRRILLVAAAPGPDVAAVRQLLASDPNAEVTAFIQKSQGQFYEGALPNDLDAFDLIVLAGYPGSAADAGSLSRIAQAAEDGMPLLFLLTRHTNPRFVQQYLADVLPVTPDGIRTSFMEALLVPRPEARQHPVFALPDLSMDRLRLLPPLAYNESRWTPSPDARVLASIQIRGIDLDDPLLVVRRRGDSRSAALLGAGTWRWRNLPEDLAAVADFWPTLLSDLVQWVTTPEDNRPVRVQPVTDLFAGGESVEFTGQVYDESLNPVPDASVEVQVTAPDGSRYPYQMESLGDGRYTLDTGVLPEGTYSYTASARRDGVELGTDQGSFAVGALTVEFKETQADAALMRQIARRSGGTALPSDDVASLPARLASSGTFEPIIIEETTETALWHRYAFLVAIIALLATEWFVRKRSGMV